MELSKTAKKWKEKIDLWSTGVPIPEKDIIYFRKSIGPCGMKCEKSKDNLYQYFYDKMPDRGYNITNEQDKKGHNYLLKNSFKLNGDLRKNNVFGEFELNVLDPNNFEYHTMTGLYNTGNGYMLPLYTAYGQGGSFEYIGNVYSMIRVTRIRPNNPYIKLVV